MLGGIVNVLTKKSKKSTNTKSGAKVINLL